MINTFRLTAGNAAPYGRSILLNLCVQLILCVTFILVYCQLAAIVSGAFSYATAIIYSLALAACIAAYYFMGVYFYSYSLQVGYDAVARLRTRLANHLRLLPLSFFRKNDTSAISGRFLHDMEDAEAVFSVYSHEIATSVIVVILFGGMLCAMDGTLGLVLVLTSFAALPVIAFTAKSWGRGTEEFVNLRALTDSTLLEYFGGIRELRATGLTGERFTPWKNANARMRSMGLAMETRLGIIAQLYIGIIDFSFVATMLVGSYLVGSGALAATTFLFFMLISGRYYEPLQNFGIFLAEFRYAYESLRRIGGILQEAALPVMPGYSPPRNNEVAFQDVFFAYGERKVLDGVSFALPEGTVTALVGESGSGKTTTANLLLRFWDVQDGSITVGGTDIRSFVQEDLYALFSVVFQDVYLFDDTIMNNIRMARPEATDEEVVAAARKACCHDFIMEFEDQYATGVGEKGSRLSGGERQRIAIARAILKNAPLLILDEATASIDPENELLIQQALTNLIQGKTLLVIAHRLSTIKAARQIIVLKDGKIAERGPHEALMEKEGIYHNLWQHQDKLKSWTVGE